MHVCNSGAPTATRARRRTTHELLEYWRREGRQHRLFFAQVEAAETIIFLTEARRDYLQGIDVPLDEPSDRQKQENACTAFRRYACKMATVRQDDGDGVAGLLEHPQQGARPFRWHAT